MLLADHTIKEYLAELASSAPAPGGGSAAALTGAIGASLISMVGALTEGRPKYAKHAAFTAGLLERARRIQHEFIGLVDEDAAVFNALSAALKLPKTGEAEAADRGVAIQTALKACALAPYKMMELCDRAMELASQAPGRTNKNAASDIGAAALSLKAAAQNAWLNVLINLGGIDDPPFTSDMLTKGGAILEKTVRAADAVYDALAASYIENALRR